MWKKALTAKSTWKMEKVVSTSQATRFRVKWMKNWEMKDLFQKYISDKIMAYTSQRIHFD